MALRATGIIADLLLVLAVLMFVLDVMAFVLYQFIMLLYVLGAATGPGVVQLLTGVPDYMDPLYLLYAFGRFELAVAAAVLLAFFSRQAWLYLKLRPLADVWSAFLDRLDVPEALVFEEAFTDG